MRLHPGIVSFNAGEVSPLLEGRVDFDFYGAAGARMENWLPTVEGPMRRRPGFELKGGPLGSNLGDDPLRGVVLARFGFRADEAYLLEVGDLYMAFWRDGGQVLGGFGLEPVFLAAPWPASALFDADGCATLDIVTSFDVAWITVPGYPPHELRRTGPSTFTLEEYAPTDGPFLSMNKSPTVEMWVTGLSSSTCVLNVAGTGASSPVIGTGDVGRLVRIWPEETGARPWEADTRVAQNDIRTQGGRFYKAIDKVGASWPHYTGTVPPTHIRGEEWDGSGTRAQADGGTGTAGILWRYLHSGFGLLRITNVQSSTIDSSGNVAAVCDCEVVTETPDGRSLTLPAGVQSTSFKTTRWELGAWSATTGYPEAVTIFKERLTFAAGRNLWLSRSDAFDSFADRTDRDILADDALTVPIGGERSGAIRWIISAGPRLAVGTDNGVVAVQSAATGEPFGPGNVNVSEQTADPVRRVRPVVVGDQVLFVERQGHPLRAIGFDIASESLVSVDLCQRAEHIARAGIVSMAWQGAPDSVLWCSLGDGSLVSLTFDHKQQAMGWARQPMTERTGGAFPPGLDVIQVASLPGIGGRSDELWICIAEQEGTYMEPGSPPSGPFPYYRHSLLRLAEHHRPGDDRASAVYLDQSLTYSGPATATLSGLDHLEGSTVAILADGATHPARVVVGGSITLDRSVTRAVVGLPYPSRWQSLRLETGRKTGTSQAAHMRIVAASVRLLEAAGVRIGAAFGRLVGLDRRSPGDPPGEAPALFTGDRRIIWPAGWRREQRITIEADGPLPATVAGVWPTVAVAEG